MLILDQLRSKDPKVRLLAFLVALGLAVLGFGLWFVQVLSAPRYLASQASQSFRTVRIPALRGRVLDATGLALAENRPAYNLNLYLEELRPLFRATYARAARGRRLTSKERLELEWQARYAVVSNLTSQVSALVRDPITLPETRFRQHYRQQLPLPLPLLGDLTVETMARFAERADQVPGCELETQPLRAYPHGTTAAHVLGYLRRDDLADPADGPYHYRLPDFTGALGVEATFDAYLQGQAGVKSVLVNNLGYRQSESLWVPADPGWDITLTLDLQIQTAAEQALRSGHTNTCGAAVVMDAQTGDVIALASNPAYDPNRFVPRINAQDWARLNDPAAKPMFNRATYGAYPPGSIFKIVVGLAALEAGVVQPHTLYSSPGYYQIGQGRAGRIRDTASGGQPADFDFKKALKQSSNAYFVHCGLLVGPDAILHLGERLHLGQKTGIPTGQEVGGTLPTREWQRRNLDGPWVPRATANLSMGQGYLTVTPLQMAVMTAAVANGGTVLWPRLVARADPPPGNSGAKPILFPAAQARDRLPVADRTLQAVREAMLADVEDRDGTGRKSYVPGLRVCGKTGTAQITRGREVIDHVTWFVSFAPYEQPRYAVVVMVESGLSGADTCAPIARHIYLALQQRDRAGSLPPELARRH